MPVSAPTAWIVLRFLAPIPALALIQRHFVFSPPVTYEFVNRNNIPEGITLDKLPADASETLRLVRIGDYDLCPCIGQHVESTKEIGLFRITSTSYNQGSFRIVFKVQ